MTQPQRDPAGDWSPALDVPEPEDFDGFWQRTLAGAREMADPAELRAVKSPLRVVDVRELTFSGHSGDRIHAWYLRPAAVSQELPTVVEFLGYGGGIGQPHDRIDWAAAGFAHVIMDTRGQGPASTGDPQGSGPSVPGFVTRGIADPETYYYTRVFTDAVLCLDTVRSLPGVDKDGVVVYGGSQGGGIALAAAGLNHRIRAALVDFPFLCDIGSALELCRSEPYDEIVRYLSVRRHERALVAQTLGYVDGKSFAARAVAPALFSMGLRDEICPPSTIMAAYEQYAGRKEIEVFPFNGHEGGGSEHWPRQVEFVREVLSSESLPRVVSSAAFARQID